MGVGLALREQQEQWRRMRMAAIRRLTKALVNRGAQRVILFGSLARENAAVGPDSDVDLVVVMPGVETE
jgi:predicted nucleotidyltransferase